jgi:hypothetical protein
MSTYSPLKIELIDTGTQAGSWGVTTNTNLGTALEEAITGSADVAFSSADVTLTLTNTNSSQAGRNLRLNLTGTSGGARNLILGSGMQIEKLYLINNGLADAVTVKNTTGTGVVVPAGRSMFVFNNGTNVVDAVTHLSSLTLGAALPVASGGSGATTLTGVLKGNGTSAFTAGDVNLTSEVTGTLPVANGGSGATTLTGVLKGNGTSAFTAGGVNLTSEVTGTLPVANGGTGQTTYTNGQLLIGNTTGNTLTKATLTAGTGVSITNGAGSISIAATNNGTVVSVGGTGTVQGLTLSGTVTSSGNLTLGGSLSAVNLASQVTGTLPVANGGTGQTTYTNGQLLIGNTTGNTLTKATLTAGTGISITNGAGSISIASTVSGGGDYKMVTFTSPGTWTKPAGLKAVKVTVVGGGGKGGDSPGPTGQQGATGGGGGGGAAIRFLPAPSIPGPVSTTVGAASGTSSFGPFASATGGVAASNFLSTPGISNHLGGDGGLGSSGDLNIRGGGGQPGIVASLPPGTILSFIGGMGGSSILGGGAKSLAALGGPVEPFGTSKSGVAGGAYGGGGSGVSRVSQPGTISGGAGTSGVVIVEEFY